MGICNRPFPPQRGSVSSPTPPPRVQEWPCARSPRGCETETCLLVAFKKSFTLKIRESNLRSLEKLGVCRKFEKTLKLALIPSAQEPLWSFPVAGSCPLKRALFSNFVKQAKMGWRFAYLLETEATPTRSAKPRDDATPPEAELGILTTVPGSATPAAPPCHPPSVHPPASLPLSPLSRRHRSATVRQHAQRSCTCVRIH